MIPLLYQLSYTATEPGSLANRLDRIHRALRGFRPKITLPRPTPDSLSAGSRSPF